MFFIYSILLINVILAKSPLFDNIPLRTDYYESFSDPVICLEVTHKFPIGPLYAHTQFFYSRHSRLPGNRVQINFYDYYFKRVVVRCEASVIFPMFGYDLKFIDIRITIYLSRHVDYLAQMDYKFYSGLRIGYHTLLDTYNNFAIRVKIINETKKHFGFPERVEGTIELHIPFIDTQNDRLCVVTKYNQPIILYPNFRSSAISGFIFGLRANIFQGVEVKGDREYPAYTCSKDARYPDIDTIFITDGPDFEIQFDILYLNNKFTLRKFNDADDGYRTMAFRLSKPEFGHVKKLKKYSEKYKKLFLIKIQGNLSECQDGSWVTVYFSYLGIKYLAEAYKDIKILPYIESRREIYRSVKDPCGELKK